MRAMQDLDRDTVHLWWLDLDAHHHCSDLDVLDALERERAARLRFDHHRRRFITHRAWLRRLLGVYLDQAPATIEFSLIAKDKPVLALSKAPTDLEFNLSHSDTLALCAIGRGSALGVDVERRRDIKDALDIGARHFGPREFAWLRDGAEHELMARFFTVWTRKEAFIKATGEGLSRALASFDVLPHQTGPVAVREQAGVAAAWYVQSFSVGEDVAAALCSRCPRPRLAWPSPPAGYDPALRPATR